MDSKHPAALLDRALSGNNGSRAWQLRKRSWLEEIFEMLARAARLRVIEADLSGDLNVIYRIEMPTPCTPQRGELVVRDAAVFHLRYCEAWTVEPPAPWDPLGVLEPNDPWHPNMKPALRGAICLGDMGGLLAGASPREILLAGYFALVLRDIVLDESDPLGVLNPLACEYYRQHPEYMPLTDAGLFDPWNGSEGVQP